MDPHDPDWKKRMDRPAPTTSPLVLAVAWIIVTVPLGWGVYQSVVKSLPLFRTTTSAASPGDTRR